MSMATSAAAAVGVFLGLMLSLGSVRAAEKGLEIELASHSLSLGSEARKLEVVVTSHDGSVLPSVTVGLVSAHSIASGAPVSLSAHEKFASLGDGKFELPLQSSELSLGKYKVRIDASSLDSGKGFLGTVVAVTTSISVLNAEVAVLESDGDSSGSDTALEYGKILTLSASHSQKLKVAFELTASGTPFKAQQVILKLTHVESGAELIYLVTPVSENLGYEYTLDFSETVKKLNQKSGAYSVDLIVGDDVMENSFLWRLVSLDLDLPDRGQGSATLVAPVSKFAPKPEIVHIFRLPEKRPTTYLSMAFLILTLIPLVGFFVGLQQLGVNLKFFPSGGLPLAASAGFHGGIAMVLGLYVMFWLQLNLFSTLQILGFISFFTLLPGFHILSYLADHSAKLKSS